MDMDQANTTAVKIILLRDSRRKTGSMYYGLISFQKTMLRRNRIDSIEPVLYGIPDTEQ